MRVPIAGALGLAACLAATGAVAAEPARIGVDSPVAAEGDTPGAGTLDFTVTRSGDTASAVALRYRTDDDTAIAPGDYVALPPSTLMLAPGQTRASVAVTINGDAGLEGDETMFLHLTFALSHAGARAFAAGDGAAAAIALDIDGDGRPDLAVANPGSDEVSVLLNTTASGADVPGFAAASAFAAGDGAAAVISLDVNGDGRPDLAVANPGGDDVAVLLNTTAPGAPATFADAGPFGAGNNPRALTATDVDGDGRPDLAVANSGSDDVSVLLNTTAPGADVPSFAAAADFAAGGSPTAITATDINGDGRPDLVVANGASDDVSVLLNTTVPGAAAAGFASAGTLDAGNSPRSVVAADLDGDGRPDLAVANSASDDVAVLLNTTAPGADAASFADAGRFAAGDSPRAVAAADLDGDGRPDLAVANGGSDDVALLLNTALPGAARFADGGRFAAGSSARSVATADVDGNGEPDLLVATPGDDSVAVLLRRPAVLDASEGIGTLENDDVSTTPDAFQFEDQADVERAAVVTSAAVTIGGIGAAVRIEVAGGTYSVGCGSSFRASSSTIANGRTVCVRHVSSADFDTATDTRLTVGGVADTFTSKTHKQDTTPDAFTFTDVRDALLNSPQISNSVTIRGIRSAAPISVAGGEYSPGCTTDFTRDAGTIAPDATVCVRHTSSAQHGTATHTTLTVGGVSDTFTSTTPGAQDLSQTGAPALRDLLAALLAALLIARRAR